MSQAGSISVAGGGSAIQFNEDVGSAVPAAGIVNVLGGAGITTTGAGNTITIALTGGGVDIDSIGTQTGTNPITADGAGLVTINGAVVAAGTNPVRSDGTGANTMAIEVQISQALAAADATKIGLSNFDSASFSVSATGFVTLAGSGSLTWINQTADLSPLVAGKAYEANKGTLLTLTLPTGGTFGQVIRVQGFGAGGWIINAGVGQTIQVNANATTVAGSVASTNQYDYIELVCSTTTTTWLATDSGGNLTLA